MADTNTDDDDLAPLLTEGVACDESQPDFTTVLTSLNNNISALAASMREMGQTLVELRRPNTQTATAKRDSRAVGVTSQTAKRPCIEVVVEDTDPDIEGLLNLNENQSQLDDKQDDDPAEDDEFLQDLATEYSSQGKTSSPISAQLAAIVDQSWSAILPDAKLKVKIEKYDRPENCGRLLWPRINPEIWSRISPAGQRQDLKYVAVQKSIVTSGVD